MRYELSEHEWTKIKPMLPNKPRGVPRVDDRRILNGIFWVLRSGAPWRDLPHDYGPHTTCYNRFVRWRRVGVWDQIMDALTTTHNAAVQIIDTSIVRVHQQGACVADNRGQHMGHSRGGLTSKIHAMWTPMVCQCNSPSRLARRMTIGFVQSYSKECSPERCCWQIERMTPTGSGHSSVNKALGPIFHRNVIAVRRSVSVPICTAHGRLIVVGDDPAW
jgi:transposase